MLSAGCKAKHSATEDYNRVHDYVASHTLPPATYHAGMMIHVFPGATQNRVSDSVWMIHQYTIKKPGISSKEVLDTFVISGRGHVSRYNKKDIIYR